MEKVSVLGPNIVSGIFPIEHPLFDLLAEVVDAELARRVATRCGDHVGCIGIAGVKINVSTANAQTAAVGKELIKFINILIPSRLSKRIFSER